MSTTPSPRTVADYKKTRELQTQIADGVMALMEIDPEAARSVLSDLAPLVGAENGKHAKPKAGRDDSAVYDKVAQLFVASGNKAITKAELGKAASLTPGAIHTLLYTTRPKSFARTAGGPGVKGVLISLTPEALAQAQAKARK